MYFVRAKSGRGSVSMRAREGSGRPAGEPDPSGRSEEKPTVRCRLRGQCSPCDSQRTWTCFAAHSGPTYRRIEDKLDATVDGTDARQDSGKSGPYCRLRSMGFLGRFLFYVEQATTQI